MRFRCSLWFLAFFIAGAVFGAAGVPDRIPAASLLVPFFETGADPQLHPQDTLLVVQHTASTSVTFHWVVWDVQGHTTPSLSGNVTLGLAGSWDVAMRDLLNAATSADREQLLQGDGFYRGFLTIDLVTEPTELIPFAPDYPFAPQDLLEGYVYYTRLTEGSSNGLTMIGLEYVGQEADPSLRDFYAGNPGKGYRERIDATARKCADRLTVDLSAAECFPDVDGVVNRIHGRVFLSPTLSGRTRLVVFAWDTTRRTEGGPSTICENNPELDCPVTYIFRRYEGGEGFLASDTLIRLDDVVNVIEVEGDESGLVSLWNVPDPDRALQVYAFVFNSAQPPGAGANWDAIFEAYVVP